MRSSMDSTSLIPDSPAAPLRLVSPPCLPGPVSASAAGHVESPEYFNRRHEGLKRAISTGKTRELPWENGDIPWYPGQNWDLRLMAAGIPIGEP